MDIRKLGLGLGAFAAGAAAWIWGASRFGDRVGAALEPALAPTSPKPAPDATGGPATTGQRLIDADQSPGAGVPTGGEARDGDLDQGAGAVPGDSTTSPVVPRPATMAAAPVGQAETDKPRPSGDPAPGHPAPDLSGGPVSADERAPEHFRPDPTAVPTADEREALRPATGPAPTLASNRGSGFSEAAGPA